MTRADRPERQPIGRGAGAILLAAMAGLVAALVLAQVTLPYAILEPGPVVNTLGEVRDGTAIIEIGGAETFPTEGELNFTTIVTGGGPGNETNVWDYLSAQISGEASILPVEAVFPAGATRDEIREDNQAEMIGSQRGAVAAALRALGHEVTETVTITGLDETSDFQGALREGDIVTGVNNVSTDGADAIRAEVAKVPIGGDVSVTVVRNGRERVVEGRTVEAGGRPVLGIFLSRAFTSDIDVTITAGNVGGPSAGLMFALGIYDVLTEGPLTGGAEISGTGTITPDGEVGPIGGVRQKVIGARDSGSGYFLAPQANCAELSGAVPDGIEVFAVATFDQALDVVESIAGGRTNGLERCG